MIGLFYQRTYILSFAVVVFELGDFYFIAGLGFKGVINVAVQVNDIAQGYAAYFTQRGFDGFKIGVLAGVAGFLLIVIDVLLYLLNVLVNVAGVNLFIHLQYLFEKIKVLLIYIQV